MERVQRAGDAATQRALEADNEMTQAAQNDWQNTGPAVGMASRPSFSVKQGTVSSGTQVRLHCSTHNAVIYYTTNGWTPTINSRRYTGPIPITATTNLQAIALSPNTLKSHVARAEYTVKGSDPKVYALALDADGLLHAKTRLHLVTGAATNSDSVEIGDKINILLDQDVRVGDAVVIPKGSPVDATVTLCDHPGMGGAPGTLAFEVHSLPAKGIQIPLHGGESIDGASHEKRALITTAAVALTVIGGPIAILSIHGGQAEIKPGMKFTVAVAADTPLKPARAETVSTP